MNQFDMHGEYRFSIEGRLLVARARGPFNQEFSKAYMDAARPLAEQLDATGPWAGITIFSGSALFTLGNAKITEDRTRLAVSELHMLANCWVIPPDVEGYRIIDMQARRIYQDVLPFEIFEEEASARIWLDQFIQMARQKAASA
jgi:hypothetical protein